MVSGTIVGGIRSLETDQGVMMFSRDNLSPEDLPAGCGFDVVDKAAHVIAVRLGLTGGVRVNVEKTEQALSVDILEQAREEGALGEIVDVHAYLD